MSLEDNAASLNAHYFLPEFTFAKTTFIPASGTELELADNVLWLDDIAIIFQMKERADGHSDAEDFRWFKKKVLGQAVKQIKDTLNYLASNDRIVAQNVRGQSIPLSANKLAAIHKVALYSLSKPIAFKSHHVSATAGFIHVFNVHDYEGILGTLLTPAEVFNYLSWREYRLNTNVHAEVIPEKSLLGYFLRGSEAVPPSVEDTKWVNELQHHAEEWDVSGILHRFLERSTDGVDDTKYHRIIAEVAKLDRFALKEFKKRFKWAMEMARDDKFSLPSRFSIPRTDCSFVFIPLERVRRNNRRIALKNLTNANKYEQKVSKCVGLSFVADDDGWFTVDWSFIDRPWEYDLELEEQLQKSNPFRPTKSSAMGFYTFQSKV